jgi:hypothetical protein
MLYIQKKKRKPLLVIGFLGMALFAVGDVLMQSFSNDGTDILLMMKSSVKDMPIERLYFSLLTGVIAAPSMYFGLCAMDSYLRDRIGNQKGKMYRCFQAGSIIGALSFFSAHSVCAVLMMAVKQALVCGITPETVDAAFLRQRTLRPAATRRDGKSVEGRQISANDYSHPLLPYPVISPVEWRKHNLSFASSFCYSCWRFFVIFRWRFRSLTTFAAEWCAPPYETKGKKMGGGEIAAVA